MHTLLGLATLLLIALVSCLALALLTRVRGWLRRRMIQLALLATPVTSLGLAGLGLHTLTGGPCLLDGPSWSCASSLVIPVGMALTALGGLGLGVARLALLELLAADRGLPVDPALQALAGSLAARFGVARPRLLLCVYDQPLAFTFGMWRSTVVLSSWLVEHLDARELEAVLAHELGHIARRDYPVMWLATVLRDAFLYLPTSWLLHHQLQVEKELACDDLAVALTRRPLALASALVKVWQRTVDRPRLGLAQPLTGSSQVIQERINRLLGAAGDLHPSLSSYIIAVLIATAGLVGWLVIEAPLLAARLAATGCGPTSLVGWLV